MFCPHCFEAGSLFSLQCPYLDFWHNLEIILLLSFGCSLFAKVHALSALGLGIPGFPW